MRKNNNYIIFICSILLIILCIFAFSLRKSDEVKSSNNITNNSVSNSVINEKTAYMSNSELTYSSNRDDYESDEQFSNFRLINVGNIKPFIYRGASPVNNEYNRAQITDNLLEKNKINYIINLSDTEKVFENYITVNNLSSSYTNSLYKNGMIYFGNLGINYETQEYAENMAKSLMQITKNEGPFYIHCNHGRDRTGMACIILEALADATYTELLNDYMKTYENYNFVNEKTNLQKYEAIINGRFKYAIYYLTKDSNISDYTSYNYKDAVKEFLKYGGLTDSEILELEACVKSN